METFELNSISDISDDIDDFDFVESKPKLSVEGQFIEKYNSYVAHSNSYHQYERIEQDLRKMASNQLKEYLQEQVPKLYKYLQRSSREEIEADGWILASKSDVVMEMVGASLGLMKRAKELLFDSTVKLVDESNSADQKLLLSQLRQWIRSFEDLWREVCLNEEAFPEEGGKKWEDVVSKKELEQLPAPSVNSYSIEQHVFDIKIIKKSIKVLKNVLSTTTSEKFARLHDNPTSTSSIRTNLFGLLDHMKRWFYYLLQRHQWFLDVKHERLPYCCESTELDHILKMLPAIELEIRQVIDDFLAHFESAFEYCESFKHTDIMYFFYETLVQMCLNKKSVFEQVCWPKMPSNFNYLNEKLILMEHQASVLEKMIFTNPLRVVKETTHPEEAYCAYIWLKSDICIQHFSALLGARCQGFEMSEMENNMWLSWSSNPNLNLEHMPLLSITNESPTSAEFFNTKTIKKQISDIEAFVEELDRMRCPDKDYALFIEEFEINTSLD